jgi:hypothetical protein
MRGPNFASIGMSYGLRHKGKFLYCRRAARPIDFVNQRPAGQVIEE